MCMVAHCFFNLKFATKPEMKDCDSFIKKKQVVC